MFRTLLLVSASLLLSSACASSRAAPGDWDRLGSRQVNFVGDRDTIVVTASEGRFDAIRLDVDRGDLEMYDVVVTFGNGERFSPETRWRFNQGTRSRVIDLPGEARFIKTVSFLYKSKLRKGRATLTLFGRQAHAAPPPRVDPPPVAPPPPSAPGPRWENLGERFVNFTGDRDTIPVTAREGRFTAIMLEVDHGDLEMYDVVVTFGNGETFSPQTRYVFDDGTRSRVIDLPGGARFIRKVDFFYRSKLRDGRAKLTLHGRHP